MNPNIWTDLYDAQSIPPAWVIKRLVPDGLTLWVGPPKESNKSCQVMACANIVAGYPNAVFPAFMTETHRTGHVLVLSAEADAGELRSMCEEGFGIHGQRHDVLLIANEPMDFRLDTEAGMKLLFQELNEHEPVLTIIDPLANFHGQPENESGPMIQMLHPLRKWAKSHQAAIILVHHTKKLGEGQRTYRNQDARGSTAIQGLVDGQIVVTPERDFLSITATFKRAAGWTRELVLGMYGETASEHVVLDPKSVDGQVHQAVMGGCHDEDELVKRLRLRRHAVVESLAKLERNGLLEGAHK